MIAGAQAGNGQQGITIVFGGLAIADGQLFFYTGGDLIVAHDPATDTVAEEDDVSSHGPTEDKAVIGRYAVYGSG